MVRETLRALSLGQLLEKLHNSIKELISGLDEAIELDEKVSKQDISDLRNHITDRLNKGEEEVENKKLLMVLNLLTMNETTIELIKEEADEWLEFVDAIEEKLNSKGSVSADEKKELEQINNALTDIKAELRK
jgi:ElaB/YqjD/DUF883 family membrane-anchored ribosome-binding protein